MSYKKYYFVYERGTEGPPPYSPWYSVDRTLQYGAVLKRISRKYFRLLTSYVQRGHPLQKTNLGESWFEPPMMTSI